MNLLNFGNKERHAPGNHKKESAWQNGLYQKFADPQKSTKIAGVSCKSETLLNFRAQTPLLHSLASLLHFSLLDQSL